MTKYPSLHAYTSAHGFRDDWAACNLTRMRSQSARVDVASWAAGQCANGVLPSLRRQAIHFLFHEAVQRKLRPETMHTAASLFDCFMGNTTGAFPAREEGPKLTPIVRRVAMTCLWIAAKAGEETAPAAITLADALQRVYKDASVQTSDLRAWESVILAYLDFRTSPPTACHWLRFAALLLVDVSCVEVDLAQYLIDLTMDDSATVAQPPERRAWAALYIAISFLSSIKERADAHRASSTSEANADVSQIYSEILGRVPPEWHTLVLSPRAVKTEIDYFTSRVTAAHDMLTMDSGVYMGHKGGGPWCTALTHALTKGYGFPNIVMQIEDIRTEAEKLA